MKMQAEAALRPLIGEPLTDMWRYAGCQKSEFGVQRPAKNRQGEEITLAELGLVVSCDWRILGPEGCVVSSDDFGHGESRRDTHAHPFYELIHRAPPVVEEIKADDEGGLRIEMSAGYSLEVVPSLGIEPEDEQWRFIPGDKEQGHLVLWGDGLEAAERDLL